MLISSFLFRIGTTTITVLLIAISAIALSNTEWLAGTQDAHLPVSSLHLPHAGSDNSVAPEAATPTPSPCGLLWRQETDPSPSGSDILSGVAAVSSNDIWAVGSSNSQTLIEHWDGIAWTVVPSPNIGDMSLLRSVAAVATDDVWAVGYYYIGSTARTLTEHWDGSQWHIVNSPNPSAFANMLWDVTAVATNDVWAVGFYVNSEGHTLAEHWNGTQWTVVPTPYLQNSTFWGVTALSANDAWAVGQSTQGKYNHAVTAHWDGSTWSFVPNDAPLSTTLRSVVAIAADDVWAVGLAVTEHWDGKQWTLIPIPNVGVQGSLYRVAAASGADVWAVGSYRNGNISLTLLLHWDGTQWTQVPGPDPDPNNNVLFGVAMVPSGEAWAVGSAGDGLILHYSDPCVTPSSTPSPSKTATPTSTPTNMVTASQTPQPSATACASQFSDVPPGSTFYQHIHCLACRGIISGYTSGCETGNPCFKPGNLVSRGQLSKIVANAAGFVEPVDTQQFEDVPPGHTFYEFVWRLADREYISGYPCGGVGEPCGVSNLPYYRPNADVTRGQLSKIVSETMGLSQPTGAQQYEDVPIGSTFFEYTWRLTDQGVMQGYTCGGIGEPCDDPPIPYFRPANPATRAQASKIVAIAFFPDCDVR